MSEQTPEEVPAEEVAEAAEAAPENTDDAPEDTAADAPEDTAADAPEDTAADAPQIASKTEQGEGDGDEDAPPAETMSDTAPKKKKKKKKETFNPSKLKLMSLDDLQTGDLLMFEGAAMKSVLIKIGTQSRYSHNAIVIRFPDGVFTSESTSNSGKLLSRGEDKPFAGVMMRKLDEMLESGWYLHVAVRKLKEPLTEEQKEELIKFTKEKAKKVKYEKNLAKIGLAGLNCYCCGRDICSMNGCCCCCCCGAPEGELTGKDAEEMFCSEWAVHAYDHIGLAKTPEAKNAVKEAYEASPNEFEPGEGLDEAFQLWEPEMKALPMPKKVGIARWRLCCAPCCYCAPKDNKEKLAEI